MDGLYKPKMMTDYTVRFFDMLLSRIDPKIEKLNEDEKKEIILRFFKSTGFIELTQYEPSDDVEEKINKIYDAMENGGPGNEQNYLLMALSCVSQSVTFSEGDKWHYFATFLAKTFADQEKSLFGLLVAAFRTINFGLVYSPLQSLNGERYADAVLFGLEAILRIDVERCMYHYVSQAECEEERVEHDV